LKKLSVEKLASAIQQTVTDAVMRQRAASLGEKIRAENGVASAIAAIEQIDLDPAAWPAPAHIFFKGENHGSLRDPR